MKKIALKARHLVLLYLKWGWPLLLADAGLRMWMGEPTTLWRSLLNNAAFAWVLCAPIVPLRLLLNRDLRERAMARLCGLREGDERERAITGEAARATLLLALSLQVILLVLSMVSVHLVWNPTAPEGKRGLLEVSMGFDSSRHLDPTDALYAPAVVRDDAAKNAAPLAVELGGYILSPSVFPVLALLILIQLAAFKAFAMRRYEGTEA